MAHEQLLELAGTDWETHQLEPHTLLFFFSKYLCFLFSLFHDLQLFILVRLLIPPHCQVYKFPGWWLGSERPSNIMVNIGSYGRILSVVYIQADRYKSHTQARVHSGSMCCAVIAARSRPHALLNLEEHWSKSWWPFSLTTPSQMSSRNKTPTVKPSKMIGMRHCACH